VHRKAFGGGLNLHSPNHLQKFQSPAITISPTTHAICMRIRCAVSNNYIIITHFWCIVINGCVRVYVGVCV